MMACATTNVDVLVPFYCSVDSGLLTINRNYVPLVNLLGVYYQIRDDYMNLQSSQVRICSKPLFAPSSCFCIVRIEQRVCWRFNGGKIFLPCCARHPSGYIQSQSTQWAWRLPQPRSLSHIEKDVLQKRPTTPTLKTFTVSYLKDHSKSFEYTLKVLESVEGQIVDEVSKLGENPKLLLIMKALHVDGTQ